MLPETWEWAIPSPSDTATRQGAAQQCFLTRRTPRIRAQLAKVHNLCAPGIKPCHALPSAYIIDGGMYERKFKDLGLEYACIMQVHAVRSGTCEDICLITPAHPTPELQDALVKAVAARMAEWASLLQECCAQGRYEEAAECARRRLVVREAASGHPSLASCLAGSVDDDLQKLVGSLLEVQDVAECEVLCKEALEWAVSKYGSNKDPAAVSFTILQARAGIKKGLYESCWKIHDMLYEQQEVVTKARPGAGALGKRWTPELKTKLLYTATREIALFEFSAILGIRGAREEDKPMTIEALEYIDDMVCDCLKMSRNKLAGAEEEFRLSSPANVLPLFHAFVMCSTHLATNTGGCFDPLIPVCQYYVRVSQAVHGPNNDSVLRVLYQMVGVAATAGPEKRDFALQCLDSFLGAAEGRRRELMAQDRSLRERDVPFHVYYGPALFMKAQIVRGMSLEEEIQTWQKLVSYFDLFPPPPPHSMMHVQARTGLADCLAEREIQACKSTNRSTARTPTTPAAASAPASTAGQAGITTAAPAVGAAPAGAPPGTAAQPRQGSAGRAAQQQGRQELPLRELLHGTAEAIIAFVEGRDTVSAFEAGVKRAREGGQGAPLSQRQPQQPSKRAQQRMRQQQGSAPTQQPQPQQQQQQQQPSKRAQQRMRQQQQQQQQGSTPSQQPQPQQQQQQQPSKRAQQRMRQKLRQQQHVPPNQQPQPQPQQQQPQQQQQQQRPSTQPPSS